jgi:hypothetical protein
LAIDVLKEAWEAFIAESFEASLVHRLTRIWETRVARGDAHTFRVLHMTDRTGSADTLEAISMLY